MNEFDESDEFMDELIQELALLVHFRGNAFKLAEEFRTAHIATDISRENLVDFRVSLEFLNNHEKNIALETVTGVRNAGDFFAIAASPHKTFSDLITEAKKISSIKIQARMMFWTLVMFPEIIEKMENNNEEHDNRKEISTDNLFKKIWNGYNNADPEFAKFAMPWFLENIKD